MFSNTELFILVFSTLIAYKGLNFLRYIAAAKRTGLPYVTTPALETEIWGYILTPIFRKLYHGYLLKGKGWPQWCRFMIKDWAWEDKRRAHDQYGDVFLVVSPEGIICYSADAALNHDVMNRRNEFTKPRDKYSKLYFDTQDSFESDAACPTNTCSEILEPYGPNVATAEGKTYRFHVRITAPPFGDMSGANDLVWSETMRQTRRLTSSWSSHVSRELQLDVNGLTLAVISRAGFGKPLDWTSNSLDEMRSKSRKVTTAATPTTAATAVDNDAQNDVPAGYKISFLRAIHDTTGNMAAILLLPRWLMRWTPLQDAALAHSQLEKYMREMIKSEKLSIRKNANHESKTSRGNLLTSVLRASASEAAEEKKKKEEAEVGRMGEAPAAKKARKEAFTDDEVMGNLFIYLLAGYETTANAILYGLIMLALEPGFQDKVTEEIDRVCDAAEKEGRDLTYEEDFEKLEYTYGFMVSLGAAVSSFSTPIPIPFYFPLSFLFFREANRASQPAQHGFPIN